METPILFVIFNRPETTQRVFEAIRQAQPRQLFVAADGPRGNHPEDVHRCQQTRDIVRGVDWPCEIKTLFRESNLGCRTAVSGAIDWFFAQVEEGIILEDDCLPHATFFSYCETLLEYYRDDPRVMQIGGCNFQSGTQRGTGSYYFSIYNHIWGWATWRRAWRFYDVNIASFPEFRAKKKIKQLFSDPVHRDYWLRRFEEVYSKTKDTWDYQWTYTIWENNGLCTLPNVNLISNIGFGVQATHTADYDPVYADRPTEPMQHIIHPAAMVRDIAADDYSTRTLFIRHVGKKRRWIGFLKQLFDF